MDNRTRTRLIKDTIPATVLALILLSVSAPASALERKLAFSVPGVVATVMVKTGQTVEAGAALARLDTRPLAAEKSAADAMLKTANRKLSIHRKNHDRTRQLFDDLSASGEQVEQAAIQFADAQAERAHAKAMADIAAWRLNQATLRAPSSGTVTAVRGYAGLVVDPAAEITSVIILSTP